MKAVGNGWRNGREMGGQSVGELLWPGKLETEAFHESDEGKQYAKKAAWSA